LTNASLAAAISAAVFRAVATVLGAVVLCACILGAIGFALVALYSMLSPSLGPATAAFATSGAALIVPALVTAGIVAATRRVEDRLPIPTPARKSAAQPAQAQAYAASALEWVAENPRTATVGALGLGVALGASPELRKSLLQGFEQASAR
jgi:hypothetical protein